MPVFYANSEAAPRGEMHGWVQGGWEMVEDNLPDLAKYLGLTKNLTRYDPIPDEKPLRTVGEEPSGNAAQSGAVTTYGCLTIMFTVVCFMIGVLQH